MSKVGMYYAYWTRDWLIDDLEPFASRVADLGFDILAVNTDAAMALPEEKQNRLREAVEANDLELTFSVGLSEKHDISSLDPATRRRGIERVEDSLAMVNRLGSSMYSGIIYGVWGEALEEEPQEKEERFKHSVESMKTICETAEELNVQCNVEVVNRFEQFLLNTAAEAVEYVEAVDHPNLKILLDTFHMNIEEDSIGGAIRDAGHHLGHLHLGENNRKPPGRDGHFPWDEFMGALAEIGYEGDMVMEPFVEPGGQVGRDIHLWRDLRDGIDVDEDAERALQFIRGKLQRST